MSLEERTFRRAEEMTSLAATWNALASSRGIQADFYDTYAWISAWLAATGESEAARLRVPAVVDGDRPLALLPLSEASGGTWRSEGLG
jgi:hypothetical protein